MQWEGEQAMCKQCGGEVIFEPTNCLMVCSSCGCIDEDSSALQFVQEIGVSAGAEGSTFIRGGKSECLFVCVCVSVCVCVCVCVRVYSCLPCVFFSLLS